VGEWVNIVNLNSERLPEVILPFSHDLSRMKSKLIRFDVQF